MTTSRRQQFRKVAGVLAAVTSLTGLHGAGRASSSGLLLSEPLSVRQTGMGDVSLGTGDVLRGWENPASIFPAGRRWQVGTTGGSLYGGTQQEFGLAAGILAMPGLAVGAVMKTSTVRFPAIDAMGVATGADWSHQVQAYGLSAAGQSRWWQGGVTVKSVQDTIGGSTARTATVDLGAVVPIRQALVGVSVRNLRGRLYGIPVAVETRAGASWLIDALKTTLAGEYAKISERDGRINLGAEWTASSVLMFRLGTSLASGQAAAFGGGVTVGVRSFAFDYSTSTHALGLSHRASLSMGFGPTTGDFTEHWEKARAARQARLEVERLEHDRVEAQARDDARREAEQRAAVAAAARQSEADRLTRGRPVLAVAELTPQNISAGDAAVAADLFRAELVRTGKFTVVERTAMQKVLAEQAFQSTGCTDQDCAIKLGKLLNVKLICVGSFAKFMGRYVLSIRVVDVQTGAIQFADAARGETEDQMSTDLGRLADRTAAALGGL